MIGFTALGRAVFGGALVSAFGPWALLVGAPALGLLVFRERLGNLFDFGRRLGDTQFRKRILAIVAELRTFDEMTKEKFRKLEQEGNAARALLQGDPESVRQSWIKDFARMDTIYAEARAGFEARFRRQAREVMDEARRRLGNIEPPRPPIALIGHPAYPWVERQMDIFRGYGLVQNGLRGGDWSVARTADYLQTLADRFVA